MIYFPEDLFEKGYTDLISVIPPGAQLTPSSKIPQMFVGKIPGRQLPNGLWCGYDWRKAQHTLEEVRAWLPAVANVGLRADRFPAVDIDVLDEATAQIIQDAAVAALGDAPVRTGRHPKRLMMYRLEGEPFSRMRLLFECKGKQYMVEILGRGQQYLVHGTHPQTLQPYAWDEAITPATDLTPITREKANAFLTQLEGALEMLGMVNIERSGDGHVAGATAGEQESLKAPSLDLLREAVRAIPNTNELFPGRDDYIRLGYAIRAAGSEDQDEAFSIYAEWAAKWKGNGTYAGNDPELVLGDWRRFKGPFTLGWLWLCEQAKQFGFDAAALDFEAVADGPSDAAAKPAPLYSDQWLADRVVSRQAGNLRFVPQKSQFLAWEAGTWQPDAELLAEDVVKRELRAIAHEVLSRGVTPKELKDSAARAEAICTAWKVPAVASLVKSDRAIAVNMNALDHDPWILNTPGGIVDLTTGIMGPAEPDALCTKSTSVLPDYNGTCPRWLAFLAEATGGDQELVAYLQRLCGYGLTGSTREQQLTFIFGPGGNGKSVFLSAVSGIFGDYARTASMDTFTASFNEKHSTDVAMLTGARLVTASETQAGKRWDEPRLKSLTGGEIVTARFMRQDNFSFVPQFKLIFVGNHKPEIRDVDAAMRRRIQMVPFTVTPASVDKELGAKLREEWPAILAWMIAGCLEWQESGLLVPSAVQAATVEYFSEEDAVGRWLKDATEPSTDSTLTSQTLYLSWREWANRTGEYVGTLKRMSAALVARKFERWRDGKTRQMGFRGLKLRELDSLLETIT
jgi:putative DNA primase/helicase